MVSTGFSRPAGTPDPSMDDISQPIFANHEFPWVTRAKNH